MMMGGWGVVPSPTAVTMRENSKIDNNVARYGAGIMSVVRRSTLRARTSVRIMRRWTAARSTWAMARGSWSSPVFPTKARRPEGAPLRHEHLPPAPEDVWSGRLGGLAHDNRLRVRWSAVHDRQAGRHRRYRPGRIPAARPRPTSRSALHRPNRDDAYLVETESAINREAVQRPVGGPAHRGERRRDRGRTGAAALRAADADEPATGESEAICGPQATCTDEPLLKNPAAPPRPRRRRRRRRSRRARRRFRRPRRRRRRRRRQRRRRRAPSPGSPPSPPAAPASPSPELLRAAGGAAGAARRAASDPVTRSPPRPAAPSPPPPPSPPPAPARSRNRSAREAPTYPYHLGSLATTTSPDAVATSTEENRIPYADGRLSPTTGSHANVVQTTLLMTLDKTQSTAIPPGATQPVPRGHRPGVAGADVVGELPSWLTGDTRRVDPPADVESGRLSPTGSSTSRCTRRPRASWRRPSCTPQISSSPSTRRPTRSRCP